MIKTFTQQRIFQFAFGLGAPLFFLGVFTVLLPNHLGLSIGFLIAYIWRVFDSFQKTCSRCSNYGSWRRGLPGKTVTLFFKKNKEEISSTIIKKHALVDWVFIVAAVGVYFFYGSARLGLISLIWPTLAYFLVYKPKRWHGLLHKL